jgi:hypothetical protein
MEKVMIVLTVIMFCGATAQGADPCTAATHEEFQAVDAAGTGTYNVPGKVVLEGIVLNKPADMVDPTADYQEIPVDMGGEWQVFIQGEGEDHAGTALYMGQNYELLPWIDIGGSYDDEAWVSEMERLNSSQFSQGDRVRVTGYYLFYKGKTNVNERHSNVDSNDFTIEVLERGVGLPRPKVVSLDELKDVNDAFIFDVSRQSGCEHYQGLLIRVNGVSFVDANGWGPGAELTVTDGVRTFAVKLGRGSGFYGGSDNLSETFDVIGIMDQEPAGFVPDCTAGYRLWVMDYDGNGAILGSREHIRASMPGDVEPNGTVDFVDFTEMAADWLK